MAHYKVMVGSECWGAGSEAECIAIVKMHKNSKTGSRGETKASTMDFKIERCEGDYPVYKPLAPLPYKPNVRIPSVGELR